MCTVPINTIKKLAKAAVRRSGFTVFRPGKLPIGSDYRASLATAGFAPSTVVDVGANVGQFSLHCAEYFRDATIYAFEPISATFAELARRTSALDQIRCFQLACANEAGTAEVFLQSQSVVNTLDPLRNIRSSPGQPSELVHTVRLDEFCEAHAISSIDLLKVDAEGFDLEVLRGAQSLLNRNAIKMVFVEVTFDEAQVGVSRFEPISALLDANGFKLSGFYNQTTRGNDERLAFADALFTHQQQ